MRNGGMRELECVNEREVVWVLTWPLQTQTGTHTMTYRCEGNESMEE